MSSKSSIRGTLTGGSDKGSHGRYHFVRRTEIWTMPRGLQENELALGNAPVDKLAGRLGRDHVLAALKDECRNIDLRQIRAVIGHEGHAGKGFGDLGIRPAEAV